MKELWSLEWRRIGGRMISRPATLKADNSWLVRHFLVYFARTEVKWSLLCCGQFLYCLEQRRRRGSRSVAEGLLPHRFWRLTSGGHCRRITTALELNFGGHFELEVSFTESLSKLKSEPARQSYKGYSGRRFCCPYRPSSNLIPTIVVLMISKSFF